MFPKFPETGQDGSLFTVINVSRFKVDGSPWSVHRETLNLTSCTVRTNIHFLWEGAFPEKPYFRIEKFEKRLLFERKIENNCFWKGILKKNIDFQKGNFRTNGFPNGTFRKNCFSERNISEQTIFRSDNIEKMSFERNESEASVFWAEYFRWNCFYSNGTVQKQIVCFERSISEKTVLSERSISEQAVFRTKEFRTTRFSNGAFREELFSNEQILNKLCFRTEQCRTSWFCFRKEHVGTNCFFKPNTSEQTVCRMKIRNSSPLRKGQWL